jgi:hypothetical protein
MVCVEKIRLIEKYAAATSAAFVAAAALDGKTYSQFRAALAASQAAHAECIRTRLALRDHTFRHGC